LVDKLNAKEVNVELLIENGLAKKKDIVKILGRGELKSKVDVTAHKFSSTAVEAIEKLGGKITTL
jgi:large subunit ribosomal protein L15